MEDCGFTLSLLVEEGTGVCEDRAGNTDRALWVIDGATSLTENYIENAESDAVWFVNEWEKELRQRIDDDISLSEIVKDCIFSLRDSYRKFTDVEISDRLKTPAATTAIVRERDGDLEYFVLGDSSILFDSKSGDVDAIIGEGPREYDQRAIEELESVMEEQNKSYREAREEIEELLKSHRKKENTQSGYWTLGFDTSAVEHADTGRYSTDQISSVHLFTDGFERIKSTFDVFADWASMIDYIDSNGSKRAFKILRAFEESDPECKQYPRLSRSDDAAIAIAKKE
jgi:hypothetical protein